jgi:hypothetical protein
MSSKAKLTSSFNYLFAMFFFSVEFDIHFRASENEIVREKEKKKERERESGGERYTRI